MSSAPGLFRPPKPHNEPVRDYAPPDTFHAPPLQPTQAHDRLPRQDLEAMRRDEDSVFQDLGWQVDPVHHVATPPENLVRQIAARYAQHGQNHPSTAPTSMPAGHRIITPVPGVDQGGTQ